MESKTMAMTSYMNLTGNNQGAMEGDCTQTGREGKILVYDLKHEIEIPRDTHTGLATSSTGWAISSIDPSHELPFDY